MTELSWPIEKIEPHPNGAHDWWRVWFTAYEQPLHFTTDELAAAGIPAEPYPTPPVTITVTVGDRSEDVVPVLVEGRPHLTMGDVDLINTALRCLAAMTAPDIVTEARRWEPYLGATPILLLDGKDVLKSTGTLPEDEAWSLVVQIARDLNRVTDLVAEVERLRHELDQRTDPELAALLFRHADRYDDRIGHETLASLWMRQAARLLGGDQ